ncbi:MAG TPA: phospholipase D-like domain-containing protein [Nevskia sp.]|nr:phospholipase D-like domain-containing protein [Nevskia sp.]
MTPLARELLLCGHIAAALGTATHALLHKRDPRAAWGWIAVCWLFPFAGAALYYLLGVNRVETKALRVFGRELPGEPLASPDAPPRIAGTDPVEVRELVRLGWAMSARRLVGGNRIEPLHNGDQAYPAMLEAIAAAQKTVHLSSYICRGDAAGKRFAEALRQARERGVEVRVLLDGLGDFSYRPRGSRLLRKQGLKPALFLPLRIWPPMLHANLRNHRKLLVVDGRIAFTGGMNIQQGHVPGADGQPRIVDLHFRVEGPLAMQMDAVFLADWSFASGKEAPEVRECGESGDHLSRVITEGPNEDLERLVMVLIGALATAHERVWIMTPYFLPPAPLASALQSAALRGVDVSIIIPARSDQPWMTWAAQHSLHHLLERQVKVYLRPPPFAHTKLILVDDWYVQFGSANLDTRSLRLNFELMVESYGKALARQLAQHFTQVRDGSQAVTVEQLALRRFPARFRDALCWLFSPYL